MALTDSKLILPVYTDAQAALMKFAPGQLYYNSTQNSIYVARNSGVDGTAEGGGSVTNDYFYEVDLGNTGRYGGYVDVTGFSGLTVGNPCEVEHVAYPITGKGTLADENEMDAIECTGYNYAADTVRVFYNSRYMVKGKFNFLISQLNLAL